MHTHPVSRAGLLVKQVMCDEEDVDPARVLLGHIGGTTGADHLARLADAGFVLGMGRFGLNFDTAFEARADPLVRMCERGYAERMVLSQDAACFNDRLAPNVVAFLPQWNHLHLGEEVLPRIRERGVSEARIEAMLVDTPGRSSGAVSPSTDPVRDLHRASGPVGPPACAGGPFFCLHSDV
ncbi:phosphotriesterase family protein [Nocardiopsis metallicus]|uniref:Putative metal-dependent phosphotriesterase family hydrolase n=1 Tax=Nocardiopsis metallicus TaxID=179819 RepID=A0A840WBG0_9ACTN|nr:hypothetical protein [Nocardiopsis metallicus]MBB5494329.1 putative metal-dependent phosphotriesterase family hydrolase [Nocardiopsis metallicus]